MKVVRVNVGGRSRLSFGGDHLDTGIFKAPVAAGAFLTRTGFRGDVQVDHKDHGGPDKAACVYSADNLDAWSEETGDPFPPGTFGENLTVAGMTDGDVCVGDVYSVGAATVRVSQPRQPCHKLAKKVGDLSFADRVVEHGRTGFYFRVLNEGRIGPGANISLENRDDPTCTIDFANDVMYKRRQSSDDLDRLLSQPALSDAWRRMLSARRR